MGANEAPVGGRGPGAVSLQAEMPFAIVQGEPVTRLPHDLYIPPDALEVFLEAFEGPLDLLLYLIRRQNLDILNVPIAEITRQYMEYIEMMKELRLELAAEYLVMAAMLAEIKSRMLLPRPSRNEDEETDPRAELVRRLQEYERYKQAAEDVDSLPRVGREVFTARAEMEGRKVVRLVPEVRMQDLLVAFKEVLQRAAMYSHHQVQLDPLSVHQRMSDVLGNLQDGGFHEFSTLFAVQEGRRGVVVTFMALLELLKQQLIELVQAEAFARLHVKAAGSARPDLTLIHIEGEDS